MKSNYLKSFFSKAGIVALSFTSFTTIAQDVVVAEDVTIVEEETKKFNISGSVDGYFRTNITSSNRGIAETENGEETGDFLYSAPSTSFANRNGFSVGMINTIISYDGEKAGFVADLVYGPRGRAAVDGEASENIVNQAYGYWNASESVTFTLGRFNTYLGYEVISPVGNFNYSTSYMFSNGPFSHSGLKADFALDDSWSAMLAVMNPTDITFGNPFDTYVLGAQIGYAADSGSAYLNFRYGNEGGEPGEVGTTFQADLTTGWELSDQFYLGFNGTILTTAEGNNNEPSTGFYGVALYPQYTISDSFALGLRGEYFATTSDADNFDSPNVIATTLTGRYSVGSLTIIPEFRLDATDEDNPIDGTEGVYTDNDGEPTGSLASFILGVVYSF